MGVRVLRGVSLGRARGGIVVDLIGSELLVHSCKTKANFPKIFSLTKTKKFLNRPFPCHEYSLKTFRHAKAKWSSQ